MKFKFSALVAPLVGIVVDQAVNSVVEDSIKIALPKGLKTATSYAIRLGSAVVAGIVAAKISDRVTEITQELIDDWNEVVVVPEEIEYTDEEKAIIASGETIVEDDDPVIEEVKEAVKKSSGTKPRKSRTPNPPIEDSSEE